jgi:hypothetical protein
MSLGPSTTGYESTIQQTRSPSCVMSCVQQGPHCGIWMKILREPPLNFTTKCAVEPLQLQRPPTPSLIHDPLR